MRDLEIAVTIWLISAHYLDIDGIYIAILNHLCSTRRIDTRFRANALYSFSPGRINGVGCLQLI